MGLEKILDEALAEDVNRHRDEVIKEIQSEDEKSGIKPKKAEVPVDDLGGGLARDIERGKKMVAKDIIGKIEVTEK